MNFILTTYIHPIEKSIIISEKLNFALDNPRTEKEIGLVLNHIKKSLNSSDEVYQNEHYFRLPIYNTKETEGILTVESIILDVQKNYSEPDNHVGKFFELNKSNDILEILAKMWIIARYDDKGEHERLIQEGNEMRLKGQTGFFMLNKGNPIIDNSNDLISYCYLLSLLLHTNQDTYFGKSFLVQHNSYDIGYPKVNRLLNKAVVFLGLMAYTKEVSNEEERWDSFYHIQDELINVSQSLDNIIDDTNKEKILYIANLLKVVGHEIKDTRYKLVTLVSIIELLLTHSPDYRRFNIEDSISKQFRLKSSILIYQNNRERDLEWIKRRLKDIYNQRSNIAHGNFKSLNDYLKKEVKKDERDYADEEIILGDLTGDIFKFIRAIIEEYIKDRKLVEFIKEN